MIMSGRVNLKILNKDAVRTSLLSNPAVSAFRSWEQPVVHASRSTAGGVTPLYRLDYNQRVGISTRLPQWIEWERVQDVLSCGIPSLPAHRPTPEHQPAWSGVKVSEAPLDNS